MQALQTGVYHSWVALGHWAPGWLLPQDRFVVDVLELTIGASAGAAVVVATDGYH